MVRRPLLSTLTLTLVAISLTVSPGYCQATGASEFDALYSAVLAASPGNTMATFRGVSLQRDVATFVFEDGQLRLGAPVNGRGAL